MSYKFTGSYILAGDPSVPHETLRTLSRHGSPGVRRRLAENAQTPQDILETLSFDEEPEVRAALASNPSISKEILDRLCQDEDPNVRLIIAEGTLLCEDLLLILAEDENPYVQARAKRGLEVCAMEKKLNASFTHVIGREARLGELLAAASIMSEDVMERLVEYADSKGLPLGQYLVLEGKVDGATIAHALMLQSMIRNGKLSLPHAIKQLMAQYQGEEVLV